jgi:prepilin-type N-terminal cleavage/methylation domain-containing protein/prepilin-type processing-associated H-X9-DG protein
MSHKVRAASGFTLVELLIVITIIGMLMAMAFPAYQTWVDAARRADCQKKLHEVASGVLLHEERGNGLPGYANQLPPPWRGLGEVSWQFMVLQQLQPSTAEALRDRPPAVPPYVKLFVCPVDQKSKQTASNSYVANCGMQDVPPKGNVPADWPANGVFRRQREIGPAFPDDRSHTLMLSENVQSTTWWREGRQIEEADVGFVFFVDEQNPNFPLPETKRINFGRDDGLKQNDYNYARPASHHTGGVNVAFCDGGARFLSDTIAYTVYCRLMIADHRKGMAKYPGIRKPLPEVFRGPVDDGFLEP